MSLVGIGSVVLAMALLVGFALLIDRGDVGLIAGYQAGDLPPDREDEFARDVRNVLLGIAVSQVPLVVHLAVRELHVALYLGAPVAVALGLVGWLLWRWNLGAAGQTAGPL